MEFMQIILLIAFVIGVCQGRRILRETHEGKRPGIIRDDEGHSTYIFYGDDE